MCYVNESFPFFDLLNLHIVVCTNVHPSIQCERAELLTITIRVSCSTPICNIKTLRN